MVLNKPWENCINRFNGFKGIKISQDYTPTFRNCSKKRDSRKVSNHSYKIITPSREEHKGYKGKTKVLAKYLKVKNQFSHSFMKEKEINYA